MPLGSKASRERARNEGDFVVVENAEDAGRYLGSHDGVHQRLEAFEREGQVVIEALKEEELCAHKVGLVRIN